MARSVYAFPLEDGGNPRAASDIERDEDGFLIHPFVEDGDPNYKFRLDVELVNETENAVPTRFTVEWEDEEYAQYRTYFLLTTGEEQWTKLPAERAGTKTTAVIPVPPGASRLGLHPPYDYGRLVRTLARLPEDRFKTGSIGKSLHGRDILVVEAGAAANRPLIFMARVHPYESIGCYFIDGMMRWLAGSNSEVRQMVQEKRVILLPVPNPDGVVEGLCKRTAGGLNLNAAAESPQPEGVAITAFLRDVKPLAFWDYHGFMHNRDGFGGNDAARVERVGGILEAQKELFDKPLAYRHREYPDEGGVFNLSGCLAREAGTSTFSGSWSWYDRDAAHLRAMGVAFLKATAQVC